MYGWIFEQNKKLHVWMTAVFKTKTKRRMYG